MAPVVMIRKMDINEHDYNIPKGTGGCITSSAATSVDGSVRLVRIDDSPERSPTSSSTIVSQPMNSNNLLINNNNGDDIRYVRQQQPLFQQQQQHQRLLLLNSTIRTDRPHVDMARYRSRGGTNNNHYHYDASINDQQHYHPLPRGYGPTNAYSPSSSSSMVRPTLRGGGRGGAGRAPRASGLHQHHSQPHTYTYSPYPPQQHNGGGSGKRGGVSQQQFTPPNGRSPIQYPYQQRTSANMRPPQLSGSGNMTNHSSTSSKASKTIRTAGNIRMPAPPVRIVEKVPPPMQQPETITTAVPSLPVVDEMPRLARPPTAAERQLALSRALAHSLDRTVRLEYAQLQYHAVDEMQTLVERCVASTTDNGTDVPSKTTNARTKQAALESKVDQLLKRKQFRFREDELRKKNSAELARLIRKYESRANLADSLSSAAARCVLASGTPIAIDDATVERVERTVDEMDTHMRQMLRTHDAFVTDSSSDSDDDDEDMPRSRNTSAANPPMRTSAMWKWHKERANLGTRFNWLQSQISDLDLKIRQQIDVCAQVCALKVPLEFAPAAAIDDDDDACTSTAARIRPLIFVSNRKLVRTAGTFKWNNKMRQLSTIHCGCSPPFSACILCTGRTNNVDTPVDVCTGNIRELYAPLDPGVHSMLTLPSAITYERRLEVHLNRLSTVPKTSPAKGRRLSPNRTSSSSNESHPTSVSANRSSTTIDNKSSDYRGSLKIVIPRGAIKLSAGQKLVRKSAAAQRRLKKELTKNGGGSSRSSTPRLSPAIAKPGKLGASSRRSTFNHHPGTYDFDNIVIDPSVLAASRIEKLEYKEITIPQWRQVILHPLELNASTSEDSSGTVDLIHEDLSSDNFERRHSVKEMDEKSRFQVYKNNVYTFGRHVSETPSTVNNSTSSSTFVGGGQRSRSASIDTAAVSFDYHRTSTATPYRARRFPLTSVDDFQ